MQLPWKAQVQQHGSRIETEGWIGAELGCAVLEIGRVRIVIPYGMSVIDHFYSVRFVFKLPRGSGVQRISARNLMLHIEGKDGGGVCNFNGARFIINSSGEFMFNGGVVSIDSGSVVYVDEFGHFDIMTSQ